MLKKVEKKTKKGDVIICTVDENGLEQGPFEIHYENGIVGKGTYKDGKREGVHKSYYETGVLLRRTHYHNGVEEGPFEMYYENGQLWRKGTCQNGYVEGPFEEYYRNGNISEKVTCHRGKFNGVLEEYDEDENGVLTNKSYWKNGKKDGPSEEYDLSRDLMKRSIWRNGEELSGREAEEYLRKWTARQKKIEEKRQAEEEQKRAAALKEERQRGEIIGGLKGKLEMLTDPRFRKPVGPARTLERQQKAQEIVDMRRARAVFKDAVEKAQEEGDDQTLQEIVKLAKPFEKPWMEVQSRIHKRGVARRAARAKKERG